MDRRWLVVVCGATLVFSLPQVAQAADRTTGLEVKAEVSGGYSRSRFPGASTSAGPFVVPLREAWESGANTWSQARRAAFSTAASVRANGIGLSDGSNLQRADRDPAEWLPAVAFRCAYVAKWISVKLAWRLSGDPAEVARLRRIVATCPTTSTSAVPPVTTTPPPVSTTQPLPPSTTPQVTVPAVTTTVIAATSSALDELEKVRIVPEYTVGYDRALFPHWKDLDGDGCDTRKEVLIRDSRTPAVVGASCTVSSGTWYSPYDGVTWTNPSDVDIDHVVALNEAWQSGAYAWTTAQRTNYANDLTDARTLMAVTDSVNQSKSDKDPTEWLPPLATYRCTYLANWVSVKVRWALTMDEVEYANVKSALTNCGNQAAIATPSAGASVPTSSASTGSAVVVNPGAFCSPFGATGVSDKGVAYTCKPSDTEARNRWRR